MDLHLSVDDPTADDWDEEHFPWSYTEFGVLCVCGSAMDSDENCLRPREAPDG